MIEFLRNLFQSDFMAHGFCYLWRPEIVWLHVISDSLIAVAYYSIPLALMYFVRKRLDLPFHRIFLMFGAFILSCGTTHAMEVWSVWHGTYRLAGVVKLITAGLSTGTAIALLPLMPKLLALPSPGRLAAINRALEQEVSSRKRAEEEIRELNEKLEHRVRERTAQFEAANHELRNEIRQRMLAEERFRLSVESAPNAMIMVNHAGRIILVNSETERLFGYRREELLGKPIEILVPESLRKNHDGQRNDFLAKPRARPMGNRGDLRAQRKDGSQFPVEIALNPIETADGTWVLSSIVDITFHRQKLESVGVLAGGIAHDFNNLLGSILADSELALSDLADGLSPAGELQSIRAVAIRSAEIVRQLMIYAGKEKVDRELVNLSNLVREMSELLKVSISKQAVLETNLGSDLPPLLANAPQIRQVVMNLILNASEALKTKEGVISITTSRVTGGQELAPQSAMELPAGEYLKLEVSDTGIGMAEDEKAKIFDPFFTTKFAGRGLGLAVVQGIVRSHGGAIDVASTPARGTTFRIVFPCASGLPKQDTPGTTFNADEVTGVSGTILVVEDEDSLRASVVKTFRRSGFAVLEAADGSAAIQLFRINPGRVDGILLDLTLPGASSREVLAEIRHIRPEMKVILTSAYDLESVFPPPDTPEVAGFIRKPFHLSHLVQTFQDLLAASR